MKLYLFLTLTLWCVFLGGGILISIAAHFKDEWTHFLRSFTPKLRFLSLSWMALLIPLLIWKNDFYPWEEMTGNKAAYFSTPFLWVRQVLYILAFFFAVRFLKRRPWNSLILFLVGGSFLTIDWGLSLEPEWSSNLYPLIYLASGTLAAYALILMASLPQDKKAKTDLVHFFLTISLFWLYLNFGQFLIIWMGNIPREVTWYVPRFQGWCLALFVIVPVLKLAPVLFISFYSKLKTDDRVIKGVAVVSLLSFLLEMVWIFLPSMKEHL